METPSQNKILCIIPTYNGQKDVYFCIDSIVKSSLKSDILIIDNASLDDTIRIIKENFEKVTIIQNKKNLGFGRALNMGFSYGKQKGYDYFLILNQDAELENNTLQTMNGFVSAIDSKDWALISPWNRDSSGNTEYYFEDNLNKRSGNYPKTTLGKYDIITVDFINAACWLVNAKALERLKGFDPRYFMYGEDWDFCNRAKYFGFKMYVIENVYCIHHKIKGDYDQKTKKVLVYLGSIMAYFTNPDNRFNDKLKRYLEGNLTAAKFVLLGKWSEGAARFVGINRVVLKVIFLNDGNR